MKRLVIIDDEPDARQSLRQLITELCPDVVIIGEANSVATGIRLIRQSKPSAVMLDIQMEDGSGFDLLDNFNHPDFRVIFTTAHDGFALKAFKYNGLDYLLKPIHPNDLVRAIEKLVSEPMDVFSQKMALLMESNRLQQLDKIVLNSYEGLIFLRLQHILRLQSDGNYTVVHLQNGERFVATRPLKEFEELLPKENFFRVHQSHIINLNFVKKYLRDEGGYVLLDDNSKIEVSRRRKEEFLEMLRSNHAF